MKKTPFYDKHIELNGKIVDFAGFKMPINYTSIIDEVRAVRESAGIFDVSHMGEIEITGPDSLDFINYITSNDVSRLNKWQAQYTTMLYHDGGIVDDLLVYKLPDKYILIVNATNTDKDREWIKENIRGNVKVADKSDSYFQIALQGPESASIMKEILDENPDNLKFYHAREEEIAGEKVILSRTGYTGEDGFEVYGKRENASPVWDKIYNEGESHGLKPCGLGARDLLRMEMGYCLYGNDISEETSPLEAGLFWLVKFDKEDFIGKEALLTQKDDGIKRKLTGMIINSKLIPRHGYDILNEDDKIGEVTSGSFSPTIDKNIALGYIKKPYSEKGNTVKIKIRDRDIEAEVVSLPFWKNGSLKR